MTTTPVEIQEFYSLQIVNNDPFPIHMHVPYQSPKSPHCQEKRRQTTHPFIHPNSSEVSYFPPSQPSNPPMTAPLRPRPPPPPPPYSHTDPATHAPRNRACHLPDSQRHPPRALSSSPAKPLAWNRNRLAPWLLLMFLMGIFIWPNGERMGGTVLVVLLMVVVACGYALGLRNGR